MGCLALKYRPDGYSECRRLTPNPGDLASGCLMSRRQLLAVDSGGGEQALDTPQA
jgi:hypothetical protein